MLSCSMAPNDNMWLEMTSHYRHGWAYNFNYGILMFLHFSYESEVQGDNVLKFVLTAFKMVGKKRSTNNTPSKIYPLMLWGKFYDIIIIL